MAGFFFDMSININAFIHYNICVTLWHAVLGGFVSSLQVWVALRLLVLVTVGCFIYST